MLTHNALRAIALITSGLAPLAAFAPAMAQTPAPAPAPVLVPPFHGEIEIDLGGLMGNNAGYFGRYNGLNSTGPLGGIGWLYLSNTPAWDSGETRYFDLTGRDLLIQSSSHFGGGISGDSAFTSDTHNGLANEGSLEINTGDQGRWGLSVTYDAITYTGNVVDSLYTVQGGLATLNHGLTPWGGATAGSSKGAITSFTVGGLNATGAMRPLQTGTRRDIFGGAFHFNWDNWTFTGAFRHDHKEGSMEESFDGPWGGTAFGLPINYDTDRYDASAAYTARHMQGLVQYTFSHFTDNVAFVNLPYPTANTSAPFQRSAAYSTPPSNSAHYLTVMLATDAVPYVRLNMNARVGLELQDDNFAPNTADPTVPASAIGPGLLNANLRGTTAGSPDIVAQIYQLRLSASTHPFPALDGRVYYGLDGRTVHLNQFQIATSGTGGSSDSSFSGSSFVVPQDWLKQYGGFEAGYRVLPEFNTRLTVGYRFDAIERSNAQVGHSWTDTATIAVLSDIGPYVNSKLSFEYSNRSGALSYVTPWLNLTGSAAPTYSGAYYQAPMTSETVTLRADYNPSNTISASLFMRFKNEDFTYPTPTLAGTVAGTVLPISGAGTGIRHDYVLAIGPDFNYRPTPNINLHLFYTYERLYYNNVGNGQCSTPPTTAVCAGTVGYFRNTDTSDTHTIGVSADWQVNEKLKLRAEYTFAYGSVMFNEFDGVFVASPTMSFQNVVNYPDITTVMHNFSVTGTYQLTEQIELILRGSYVSWRNNDWNDTANAVQGAGTSAISFLTPGYSSPNYSVVALLAGVKVRF